MNTIVHRDYDITVTFIVNIYNTELLTSTTTTNTSSTSTSNAIINNNDDQHILLKIEYTTIITLTIQSNDKNTLHDNLYNESIKHSTTRFSMNVMKQIKEVCFSIAKQDTNEDVNKYYTTITIQNIQITDLNHFKASSEIYE
jgi:hypothetical protein